MAAVAVSFDAGASGRIINADSTTGWTAIGGAITADPDFFYQGSFSISNKVKASSIVGHYYTSSSTNMSATPRVWLAKVLATNKDALASTDYMRVRIGSATTAYYSYLIFTNSSYPISGGWQIVPIDPNVSGYRTSTTGSPSLTAVIYWAITGYFSTSSKSENLAIDAIDYINSGTGLTLVGGDSTDADGTFQSFITYDEGTSTNRYGIVATKEGVIYITGVITIGTSTATVFTDSNQTIVFPTGRFDTGFCGIDISLASATSVIDMSAITMIGRGSLNYLSSGCDTRPDFTVTGTTATNNSVFDTCTWNNFRTITFTSKCTITDSTFYKCLSITPAQGTLDNCVIEASPCATNTACVTAADITDITNCSFISGGTGHALVISSTTGTPFAFSGNTFSGYSGTPGSNLTASSGSSEAAIYNNSGGAITINITNSGTVPSVRNGAGATTTINNFITLTATVQDEGANPINGAQVAVYKTSDNSTIIAPTTTNASGIVTGSVAASTGAIYVRVRQSNTADSPRYYPNSTVGTIGTTAFDVTITMIEDTTVT